MGFFRKLFRRGSETVPHDDHGVVDQAEAQANGKRGGTEPLLPGAEQQAVAPEPLPPETEPASRRVTTTPLDPERVPATPDGHADGTNILNTHQLDAVVPLVAGIASTRGLAAWAARDVGRVRRSNQDSVYSMLMSLPDGESDVPVGLFVVADGMGGHTGGEIASRRAIETVMVTVLEQLALPAMADEEPGNALPLLMVNAVQEANTRIWQEAQHHGSDMGTTCTAVLLVDKSLYIAHVGDSRAYLATPAGLQPLTTDHSTVGRLITMKQITLDEARTHPLRNQLYRTVGQHPEVQVDSIYQATEGISHILLCSDGLWGMVDDDDLATIIAESPWPYDACQRLIAQANLAGGEDNISAVVVSLPSAH